MATIRTVDKRKIEIEIGGAKLEEEIGHVAGREVPLLRVKLAGKDDFVWVNAAHIVSVEDD
jgi:hypothetical protein